MVVAAAEPDPEVELLTAANFGLKEPSQILEQQLDKNDYDLDY